MTHEFSMPDERVCTKCDKLKPLSEFYNHKNGKYGKVARM